MLRKTLTISLGVVMFVVLALAVVVLIRLAQANVVVQQGEAGLTFPEAGQLGSTRSLTILPLYENAASRADVQTGNGVAYLIQTDDAVMLMDTGHTPSGTSLPLAANMQALGISADSLDVIVISHNHPDHVGGLQWWLKGTFALNDSQTDLAGLAAYVPTALTYPGLQPTIAEQPQKIATGVATLGRQPFIQPFPFWLWQPLELEQSLAIQVEGHGLVLVTGCGHPSLERIVARAEALFGLPIAGVVGGLHYGVVGAQDVQPHVDFLAERRPQRVALSPHDSSPAAIEAFRAAFPAAYQDIEIGTAISLP